MSSALLTQAVTSGDAGDVSALLANGANANERTSGGQTPLILATIFGHTHLIPLLLNAGADPHLRDNLGLNALDWAQRKGATDAIALLNHKRTTEPERVQTELVERNAAPQARKERDNSKPVSSAEKSQRWLAGLKQRIAEQSQPEVPDGSNIFRAVPREAPIHEPQPPEPQLEVAREPVPPPQPEPRVEIAPEPAPQITQIAQTEERKQTVAEAPKTEPPQKRTRKRCPKCGAIYNSDLVAYCAHHVVELVDADAPIISEPPRSPVLFWMLIVIVLTGSLVVGSVITTYLYSRKGARQAASAPGPKTVQRGTPLVDPALEGKVVSLPVAECPLNGQEAIPGTVVVRVVINKDGQVTSARASGGDWLLRGAASEAAMKSTFWPEKLRGREAEGTITYTFEP